MPHPERHTRKSQHPRWTRGDAEEPGDGLKVFLNAVEWVRSL
jgi:phosphoribosylformylglycinamidine (FGAM) synthase-like amidotransferase family enzyme